MKILLIYLSIFIITFIFCNCKKQSPIHLGSHDATSIDPSIYQGIVFKDAFTHFNFSESNPDLVNDNWKNLPGYLIIATADSMLTKGKVSLGKPAYSRGDFITELSRGSGLNAYFGKGFYVVSPLGNNKITKALANAESFPALAALKACKLQTIEVDDAKTEDLFNYLNERIEASGQHIRILIRPDLRKSNVFVSMKNVSALDMLVVLSEINNLKIKKNKIFPLDIIIE